MVAVRQHYATPLTAEELFAWHTLIFPGSPGIAVGNWRTHAEPMQVVSGAYGKEKVHFEAPPSERVPDEMRQFIRWFNDTAPGGSQSIKHAPVRAALAHLYFESIHPFEDGNGRIGRAVAEKALSQSIGRPVVLSLSSVLEANKNEYYAQLQKAQRTLTVDQWLNYFAGVVLEAQVLAGQVVRFTLKKARFLDKAKPKLNERQRKVIERMLQATLGNFEGGMNARKYVSLTQASKATATRDLQELVELGILVSVGKGRSYRYDINIEFE
jgi:Fic family protein